MIEYMRAKLAFGLRFVLKSVVVAEQM